VSTLTHAYEPKCTCPLGQVHHDYMCAVAVRGRYELQKRIDDEIHAARSLLERHGYVVINLAGPIEVALDNRGRL
jgi:hypothetical protein